MNFKKSRPTKAGQDNLVQSSRTNTMIISHNNEKPRPVELFVMEQSHTWQMIYYTPPDCSSSQMARTANEVLSSTA